MSESITVYRGADDPSAHGGNGIDLAGVSVLGPSFSESSPVAESYNPNVKTFQITPSKVKHYRSYDSLRLALFNFAQENGYQWGLQDRANVALVFKNRLIEEGFDAISFPEGFKQDTKSGVSNTWICLNSSIIQQAAIFNLKLHKKAEVDLKDRILKLKRQLEDARRSNDVAAVKIIMQAIKKAIAEDSYSPIERVEKPDRGPVRTPGSRSPSFGRFNYDN